MLSFCFLNPYLKEYSFSPTHQSFSRIDYYFIDAKLISKVKAATNHSIVIYDHPPLSLDIQFSSQPRYFMGLWRRNTLLLSDQKFNKFILRPQLIILLRLIRTSQNPALPHCYGNH